MFRSTTCICNLSRKYISVFSYLCAGVLWVAVQVGEHTGERVNIRIDFGVIARRLLRTTVLTIEQRKKHVSWRSKCR